MKPTIRTRAMSPEHKLWLDSQMKTLTHDNPCVRKYGEGPAGKKCKDCRHLIAKRYSKTYYKCTFRGDTNGPGTDHRVSWQACAKWE